MSAITLETLNVVLRAQYAEYQKDMEKAKEATRKAREAVETEKKKINDSLQGISTQKAREELSKLQTALTKQTQQVAAQEAVIANLKNKYQDLLDGITGNKTASSLERQLKAAEKELAGLDRQLQPLLDKLTAAEEFESMGLKMPEMDAVRAQIDAINPKYDELEDKISRLRKQLAEVKLHPDSTTEAKKLQQEIELAQDKLRQLKDEAAATDTRMQQLMNRKGTLRERINAVISRMRSLKTESGHTTTSMHGGLSKVTDKIDQLRRRLTGLISSVLIFNAISKGIQTLRDNTAAYLHTNQEFSASLREIQTNLKVAFAPLYEWVLPGLNALMDKLADASRTAATFVSALFGKTYNQSYQAAQGMEQAKDALESYGSAAEKSRGLASFDELNNITETDSSGGGGSDNSSMLPDMAGETQKLSGWLQTALEIVQEFKGRVKEIIQDFKLGDWLKAGADISDLIVWGNEGIAKLLKGIDWDGAGTKVGEFLKGIKWLEILKSLKDVLWEAIKGAASFWFAAFEEAPFETALITAIALWKFTGFGKYVGGLIGGAIPTEYTTSLGLKIAAVTITAAASFNLGKEIGKFLFPEDAEWYDNFHWFGEGGFFDMSIEEAWNGLIEWAKDSNSQLGILIKTKERLEESGFELSGWAEYSTGVIGSLNKIKEWDGFSEWWDSKVSQWFAKEKWESLGNNIKSGLHDKSEEFFAWWDEKGAPEWFTASVSPFLTKEKWSGLGSNIKAGLKEKSEEFFSWWEESGVSKWFTVSVGPWFTKKRWEQASAGMKEGLISTVQKMVSTGAELINKLIDWINEKLHLKLEPVTMFGKTVFEGADIQLFTVPKIPIQQYAAGGIVPRGQIFQAREAGPELVASFGGQTAVLNNDQIVQSVSGGVESGTYRAISPILTILREILVLLEDQPDRGGGGEYDPDTLFNLMRQKNQEYYERNGEFAFS